jgi:hypothetical protein
MGSNLTLSAPTRHSDDNDRTLLAFSPDPDDPLHRQLVTASEDLIPALETCFDGATDERPIVLGDMDQRQLGLGVDGEGEGK